LQTMLKYTVILHEVFKNVECNASYRAKAPGKLCSEDFA
jgi:hypothetical protein